MSDTQLHQRCSAEMAKDPVLRRRYEHYLEGWREQVQQLKNKRLRGIA